MSRETIKKNLPFITTYAEGKTVECRYADQEFECSDWEPVDYNNGYVFADPDYEFRVKPGPREFWLFRDKGEEWKVRSGSPPNPDWDEVIRVREVTEE